MKEWLEYDIRLKRCSRCNSNANITSINRIEFGKISTMSRATCWNFNCMNQSEEFEDKKAVVKNWNDNG